MRGSRNRFIVGTSLPIFKEYPGIGQVRTELKKPEAGHIHALSRVLPSCLLIHDLEDVVFEPCATPQIHFDSIRNITFECCDVNLIGGCDVIM